MQRFQGLIGIVLILGLAFLASNNRKKINYRLVICGILLQSGFFIASNNSVISFVKMNY